MSPIFAIQKYYRSQFNNNWNQPPTYAKLIVDIDTQLMNNITRIRELYQKATDPIYELLKQIKTHDRNMNGAKLIELINKFNSIKDQINVPNDYIPQQGENFQAQYKNFREYVNTIQYDKQDILPQNEKNELDQLKQDVNKIVKDLKQLTKLSTIIDDNGDRTEEYDKFTTLAYDANTKNPSV
eukprot:CAMPEP_0174825550 /NCGR_PEP_ID=MMETSP1107-20130205/42871_1 /TAXON_ID=36770 /ORGANISM="Paraphysomonas vestita, Strain GFlagA" /LENGTH=182 /DNA_ID=CAMNT_0016057275 /DNA_START=10 /DNA_END=558 /DNA_ORIENTATION=-